MVVHEVSVKYSCGHSLHPKVDEGPSHGHEEEECCVVPREKQRYQHHLVVVILFPFFSRRWVKDEADLIEPRPLQEEEEEEDEFF